MASDRWRRTASLFRVREQGSNLVEMAMEMTIRRIDPNALPAKQKETYNFQKLAGVLADYGFACIKLDDDWKGADFLAYHIDGETTLKVQLKSRCTIATKYLNKNIWIAFIDKEQWYLVPHDTLKDIIGATTNWLKTSSWKEGGWYGTRTMSETLKENLKSYAL